MKLLKKITAAVLAGLFMLSASACHRKNEIAVTVGDVEFTSAYYMCAMIYADMEARQKVDDSKSNENDSESSDTSSEETDYSKEKIDGVDFSKYVKEETLKSLKQIAAYKMLCKENELELDEETESSAEQYAESMWSYGYSTLFEENGVYKSTLATYITDSYYASLYFDHIYGAEGKNAISSDEVLTEMKEKLVLVQTLSVSFSTTDSSTGSSTQMTEDEISALKTEIGGYANDIAAGKKTFEQVYHEYNGTDEADDAQSSADETDETESTEEELEPVYNHASVYGDSDTDYANDNYETVKAMAIGEVKVIELDDSEGLLLVIKRDFSDDPYYIDALDSTVRHLIKDSDMENEIDAFIESVKVDVSSYAINRFKVNKIVYPSAS